MDEQARIASAVEALEADEPEEELGNARKTKGTGFIDPLDDL
jgi:hypothetical protein